MKKMQPNLENKQQHIWQFIKNPLILISFGCSAFVFHTKTLFCVEKEEVNHIKCYNNNDKVQLKEAGAKEELQPIHLIVCFHFSDLMQEREKKVSSNQAY